jgi:hypothetical protein
MACVGTGHTRGMYKPCFVLDHAFSNTKPCEEVELWVHSFLTLSAYGLRGRIHAPATLSSVQEILVPIAW